MIVYIFKLEAQGIDIVKAISINVDGEFLSGLKMILRRDRNDASCHILAGRSLTIDIGCDKRKVKSIDQSITIEISLRYLYPGRRRAVDTDIIGHEGHIALIDLTITIDIAHRRWLRAIYLIRHDFRQCQPAVVWLMHGHAHITHRCALQVDLSSQVLICPSYIDMIQKRGVMNAIDACFDRRIRDIARGVACYAIQLKLIHLINFFQVKIEILFSLCHFRIVVVKLREPHIVHISVCQIGRGSIISAR